ncbi:hypothetical protein [Pseudoduganella lutea]|uniref:Uncharacterized protein n=1 Tax=Pseudoduganella lutea TaxID=321985 RepID=A0A4P6L5E6_9BURK|nr:hypothetical protein [Pseudoduganella lutea]QBE66881.1 hypothetical protein EWM63_31150 [Pseudoduganella lutea]
MTVMVVTVDGVLVAAADLAVLDIFAVHMSGDLAWAEPGSLACHGGAYPVDAPSTFRIWTPDMTLVAGQVVTVRLAERPPAAGLTQGRTIAELYPEEPPCERTDFTPTAAEAQEARDRPRLRQGFSWSLTTHDGEELTGCNGPEDDSFGFSVVWTSDRPAQARARGYSSNLERVLSQAPGTRLHEGTLAVGESLTFSCGD